MPGEKENILASSEKCNQCEDLNKKYRLNNRWDFKQAIKSIKDNLEDGTIAEIDPREYGEEDYYHKSFSEIKEDGPWNDYVLHYFKCNHCGLVFRLGVETYHGSGGYWEVIKAK